ADVVAREGRLATVPLSGADHQGYYLGYANSVLWPVFHNRLDLAQFEAGFFERFVAVNSRLAALLEPLLRPVCVIWGHDYHLIPFAAELRKRRGGDPKGVFFFISFPPRPPLPLACPSHPPRRRRCAARP